MTRPGPGGDRHRAPVRPAIGWAVAVPVC